MGLSGLAAGFPRESVDAHRDNPIIALAFADNANAIADRFKMDDARFDRVRFLTACGF